MCSHIEEFLHFFVIGCEVQGYVTKPYKCPFWTVYQCKQGISQDEILSSLHLCIAIVVCQNFGNIAFIL